MKQKNLASWIFGGTSFAFLLVVFFFAPKELPTQNHRILGLMAAFAAGFLGFFMSGTLGIDGTTLLKPYGKFAVKAGGGLALFLLVLFWWNSDGSPTKTMKAIGDVQNTVNSLARQLADTYGRLMQAIDAKDERGGGVILSPSLLAQAKLLVESGDKKQRAIAEIALGHTRAAAALLGEVATGPVAQTFEIFTLQGDNWFFASQEDSAIGYYEQALAVQPNNTKALLNLGAAHTWAHQGSKLKHVESAIALLERASAQFLKYDDWVQWARAEHLLADAFGELPPGRDEGSLEKAIDHYERALTVRTKEAYPEAWAVTQTNLAGCLVELQTGNHIENVKKAIAIAESAQEVFSKSDYPFEYARLQNSLADAFSELPGTDSSDNLRKAISLYEQALGAIKKESHPDEWASTQNSLACAWIERTGPGQMEYLQKAIAGYNAALTIYTQEDYPADWARTNYNLSIAYTLLAKQPGQSPSVLLRKVAELLGQALTVWSETEYPADHRNAVEDLERCRAESLAIAAAHH